MFQPGLWDFEDDEARRLPVDLCEWKEPCDRPAIFRNLAAINGRPHLGLLCAEHDRELQELKGMFKKWRPLTLADFQVSGGEVEVEEAEEEPVRALSAAADIESPEPSALPVLPIVPSQREEILPEVPEGKRLCLTCRKIVKLGSQKSHAWGKHNTLNEENPWWPVFPELCQATAKCREVRMSFLTTQGLASHLRSTHSMSLEEHAALLPAAV